ncbi:hypothetical protein ROU88_08210 [Macrococcus capreoli]
MTKSYLKRAIESIEQDKKFEDSIQKFKNDEYEIFVENTIKQFVVKNQDEFDGLFTEKILEFNMTEYYQYVIETFEKDNNNLDASNTLMNITLDKIINLYEDKTQNRFEYVYVIQRNDGMISVVGKSYFKVNHTKRPKNKYIGNNDLFKNIAFFKYDKYKDNHKDKINLSLISLGKTKPKITGTQAVETIKYCIKKTGNQSDINVLNEYFKKNKEEIRQKLRRLYKKAWIIPIKGEAKNANDFETALGNHLEKQKDIFISNKDSHKY